MGQRFFCAFLILAGSLLGAALMLKLTQGASWAAFLGWVIFFLAIQSPFLLAPDASRAGCTSWLTRLRRKG